MPVSIKIPKTLTNAIYKNIDFENYSEDQISQLKKVSKTLIEKSIRQGLKPCTVIMETEHDFVGHITINILPKYNRQIIVYSKEMSKTSASIALGLLVSAINQDWHLDFCDVENSVLEDYLNAIGYQSRKEQARFYSYVDDSVESSKVSLIEASTGVGKTLSILVNANEKAKAGCISAIATNSINNMRSYLSDYNLLKEKGIGLAPIHIMLGRQNFVSISRLNSWLEHNNCPLDRKNVEQWIKRGGRNNEDCEAIPSYTIESLKQKCPELIDNEVALKTTCPHDDLGAVQYTQQFKDAFDADNCIMLISHAMLCIDIRMRLLRHGLEGDVALSIKEFGKLVEKAYKEYQECSDDDKPKKLDHYLEISRSFRESKMAAIDEFGTSLLPNYEHLYVDEGHLLENAMANAISTNISIKGLMRDVEMSAANGTFPSNRAKDASRIVGEIIKLSHNIDSESIMLSPDTYNINALIMQLCETLSGARNKKGNEDWLEIVSILRRSVNFVYKQQNMAILEFSPVRAYPSINTGEINCSRYFKHMWARLRSATIVSATLYIKRYNAYSCSYMQRLLSVDSDRLGEYPPVQARWIKDTVKTVYLPCEKGGSDPSLMPVGRQFQGDADDIFVAKSRWAESLSKRVSDAYQRAAGGTLVLMTSYAEVTMMVKHIPPHIPLVFANSNTTLDEQKQEFIELSKQGKKPLWVALGNAWVGMDVSGKDIGLTSDMIGEHDNVLTTLIIAKIPFGINRSLSHKIRSIKEMRPGDSELMDTLMRLKQGLGRLVRLEGQPKNREIYLLDGRYNHPRYRGYMAPIRALFESYPNSEKI